MSYSVLSCVSLRFYPLSSGIVALVSSLWFFGSPLFRFPFCTSASLHLCPSVPLSLCSPVSPLSVPSFSSLALFLPSLPSDLLPSALFSVLVLFSPSPCSLLLSSCSLPLLTLLSHCPPLSEPDRRAAEIYFAAAFLVVAFLAAGFFAVFASSFTAVLAGDFRAAGSFSTFASALTALLRAVFFFGSGVPALRA